MKVHVSGTNPLYSIFLKNVQSHFLISVGLCITLIALCNKLEMDSRRTSKPNDRYIVNNNRKTLVEQIVSQSH